jgi:hypothetical protein
MVMPMMPPGSGMPPMGGPPMRRDPMVDMAAMRDLMEQTAPPQPVYPKWFTPPKRPDAKALDGHAIRLFDEYSVWRAAIRHDLEMLRMRQAGVFRNDILAVKNEVMEQVKSTGLVDEYNLAVSWLSGLRSRIDKDPGADELKVLTRKVKLAAQWLDKAEAVCHTDKLEMERSVLEPKVLLAYGTIVKRRVLDRQAEPYYSPFFVDYIDPAQVIPVRDARGIKAVFRVYSAKVREIADAYGDFTPSQREMLKKKYGNDLSDETELTQIVEYWDRWYRSVTCHGAEILPVTEHRYGEVPYTIGYGPLGEPLFTTLPEETGAASMSRETFRDNLPYKSVSYVRFRKESHILHEAILTRSVYGLELDHFPPTILYRTPTADQAPPEEMTFEPGAQNLKQLGEEKVEPMPRNPQAATSHAHVTQQLERDRLTGSAPLSAYGHMDQSNISGTANKQANSAGLHLWKPWAKHLESFRARDLTLALRMWQRLGHTVEYATPQRRPFVVPVAKPYSGEPGSFELDRDTLNKVGPDVRVSLVSHNTDEWLLRAQTMQFMRQEGFPKEWLAEELFGVDMDEQMIEESQEDLALAKMWEHPKFLELIGIPARLATEIAESEGDPENQALLAEFMQKWDELMVQPAMLEHQMKMQQMQMQAQQMMAVPGPDEAVPVGQGPPPQQAPGGLPPTTSGVSLPDLGSGPGSVSGNQSPGRPAQPGQGGY